MLKEQMDMSIRPTPLFKTFNLLWTLNMTTLLGIAKVYK